MFLGVVYHGDRAITGTADAVHKLKKLVQIIIIMRTLSVSLCVPIMCENGIDGYARYMLSTRSSAVTERPSIVETLKCSFGATSCQWKWHCYIDHV